MDIVQKPTCNLDKTGLQYKRTKKGKECDIHMAYKYTVRDLDDLIFEDSTWTPSNK